MSIFPDGQNRYGSIPLFLAGILFVALAPVFWLNTGIPPNSKGRTVYESVNLYEKVFPAYHYGFGRLQAGSLPLWNTEQWCGTPFQADPSMGVFQPLNAPFLLLPAERAFAVHGFLCLFLMGLFFVVYLRSLDVHYIPALIGGAAYAYCGASAAALPCPEVMNGLVWLPLVFWAVREFIREGRYSVVVLGGVFLGMMMLAGSLPLLLASLLVVVPYGFVRLLFRGADATSWFGRRLKGLMLLPVLAVLVSAVQWIPSCLWVLTLDAPLDALTRLELAGQLASRPQDLLLQFLGVSPDILPYVGYMGIAALLSLPVAVLHKTARVEMLFFFLSATACSILSVLGKMMVSSAVAYDMLMYPACFSLAVLAALGADRLFTVGRDPRSPLLWASSLIFLAGACVLFYISSAEVRGRIIPLIAVVLVFLVFRVRWLGVVCSLLVLLLLFIDLHDATIRYYTIPPLEGFPAEGAHAKMLETMEEHTGNGRVLVNSNRLEPGISGNIGMVTPLRAAGGTRGALTKDQARWWSALSDADTRGLSPRAAAPALLNHMAVRALLVVGAPFVPEGWEQEGVRLRPVRSEANLHLYVNETAWPRCRWVPHWRVAPSEEAAIKLLGDSEFDAARMCTLEVEKDMYNQLDTLLAEGMGTDSETPASATCVIQLDTPEKMGIHVEADVPGIVVLADTFAPGWKAMLDGAPVSILKANGLFRGVAVPAGTHTIEFTYQPLPFWAGFGISAGTLGLLLLCGMAGSFHRPQKS
ncbi:MAG TPA: YfhO family protein [Candidatus Hydrogenedentes bacterium]|nr:YfhO family protein [Candidatus Hydrogenedentota bacterium]